MTEVVNMELTLFVVLIVSFEKLRALDVLILTCTCSLQAPKEIAIIIYQTEQPIKLSIRGMLNLKFWRFRPQIWKKYIIV